jgi:hypothetical protein
MRHEAEKAIGIGQPIQLYPLFENALRARDGLTPTSTAAGSRRCGRASVTWPRPTPTHGSRRRSPQPRSQHRHPTTA